MIRSLLLCPALAAGLIAASPASQPLTHPLVFEPNVGQAPSDVAWLGQGPRYHLSLYRDGLTMTFPRPEGSKDRAAPVTMHLKGSNPWVHIDGSEPTGGTSNYLVGANSANWRTGVPHYARVAAANVYDGIDLVLYARGGDLEYDFVIAPGADPSNIRLAFDGVDQMRIEPATGDLLLTVAPGIEVRHRRPKVYQSDGGRRVEVAGLYNLVDRHEATFTLATYNRQLPLVIDPSVVFTTFIAGENYDRAQAIAIDAAGDSYITGFTDSHRFPLVGNIIADQGTTDAFVTKLSPSGVILFSTYLGGGDQDWGNAIAVDSSGVFVTGTTLSSDFPTKNAIFPSLKGASGIFITKLSLTGNALIYSTLLGGSSIQAGGNVGYGIAVDLQHAAYVTGGTDSPDFPISAWSAHYRGFQDAFVVKISPDGTFLTGSALFGGGNSDFGTAIKVDRFGFPWVTGMTCSSDFPHTPGLPDKRGFCNAFVMRLSAALDQTLFSAYVGGEGYDRPLGIAIDFSMNAYVTGWTNSAFFDTTAGSFEPFRYSRGNNGFVAKLDIHGNQIYATYLGGFDGDSYAESVAVSAAGEAYVAGHTTAIYFPGLPPLQPNPATGFVAKMNAAGNALTYVVPLGADSTGVAIAEHWSPFRLLPRDIFVTGLRYTGATDGAHADAFVVRLKEDLVNTQ